MLWLLVLVPALAHAKVPAWPIAESGRTEKTSGINSLGIVPANGLGASDLDVESSNWTAGLNPASGLLPNGNGTFPSADNRFGGVALGKVEGEQNYSVNAAAMRLHLAAAPVVSGFSPSSAAAGTTVAVVGTGLADLTAFTVNGVSVPMAAISNNTATGFSFVVPAGATATGTSRATTANGSGSSTGFTVLLRVVSTSPAANARTAPLTNSAVGLTFTEPVTAASAAGIRVFSAQAGGRKAGTVSLSGSTVSFRATVGTPRTNFKPGEIVRVTQPATVRSISGLLAPRRVYQFTTAVGGTGTGNFTAPAINPSIAVDTSPNTVVLGDVDGDGDLDLLTSNVNASTVSIRLNNGSGSFTAPATNPNPAVGANPFGLALGDVDGDGDLDLLTANNTGNTVSVRLNNGSGSFTAPATNPNPAVGDGPNSLALGDVDGDGDLDLLTSNYLSSTVSIRLNNGSGSFTAPATNPNPAVGSRPYSVVVGDVDGDGDLDLLTANYDENTVSVRLNNGSGSFTAPASNPTLAVGANPISVTMGDVDGDLDLDLLVGYYSNASTVSVRLNDGSGNFTAPAMNPNPAVGSYPQSVAVGDVDGDGDLDLFTANNGSNSASVRLNDGSGNFTAPTTNPNPALGTRPSHVAVGDVDGDGDLDLLTANFGANSVTVRLNQPFPLSLTSILPAAELPGMPVTLTGNGFEPGSSVSFGGVAASVTYISSTSLTAIVPTGALAGNSTVVVTASGVTTATAPAFTVLAVHEAATTSCPTTVPYTAIGDGKWHYLLTPSGQVVAALQDTRAALGSVSLNYQVNSSTTPVRQDGAGHYYLDRNFQLTASGGRSPGPALRCAFTA
ncbi:FG-GAP-like repeat-containing protein [Hymenobacter cellulosilyticus]|uniref:FG-GAP-like repeat-containing protein n=1 Tax=Hymenobacter cellulosilyticus TaxID=2932248 RepID=A0A8T9QD00_9BACT|nr:FG-GAP-like repeat-containing protein [Hymenobacter cellulosilyticus]UOQ75105.1 FG-GAP-like repeat-containing protein [Hymenobacter cellulosilyticus]